MTDDLFERLRTVDPATEERIAQGTRALGNTPGQIVESEPSNVRRFPKAARRKATLLAVAAVVVVAIALPLTLLRSLGEGRLTTFRDGPGNWVTVGTLADIRSAGVTYVPTPSGKTIGVFVIAPDNQDPYALGATPMDGLDDASRERVLYCPADGGTLLGSASRVYALNGDVIEGPADHGLSPVGLRVRDGSVQIDPDDLRAGIAPVRIGLFRSGCESAGGAPFEGSPGFGVPLGTPLPPIAVALPQSGMRVSSPITITGSADVFEATVNIRVLNSNGEVIAESFAMATCGTGCRGDFSTQIDVPINAEQPGTIQVFEYSAKDGSMINVVDIPVTLVPSVS